MTMLTPAADICSGEEKTPDSPTVTPISKKTDALHSLAICR